MKLTIFCKTREYLNKPQIRNNMYAYEISLYADRKEPPLDLSYILVEGQVLDIYRQTAKGVKKVTKQEKPDKIKVGKNMDVEMLIRKLSEEETKSLLQKIKT